MRTSPKKFAMAQNTSASRVAAPEALHDLVMDCGNDGRWANRLRHLSCDEERSTMKYSTSKIPDPLHHSTHLTTYTGTPSALAKTAIVTLLGWLLAWCPTVAMLLGKIVSWVWPGFRGDRHAHMDRHRYCTSLRLYRRILDHVPLGLGITAHKPRRLPRYRKFWHNGGRSP
jgi:hypothetical protein